MGNMDLNELARQLGIDQFKLGPIPIGPKMTFEAPPVQTMSVPMQQATQTHKLNLEPNDSTSPEASERAARIRCEGLTKSGSRCKRHGSKLCWQHQ